MRTVTAYPWQNLPRVSRSALRDVSRARQALDGISVERIAKAVGELTASEVSIVPRKVGSPGAPGPDAIGLAIGDTKLVVALEPALVALALSRVLSRPAAIDSRSVLEPALRGALAAVLVEVARRSGATEAVNVLEPLPSERALRVEATLTLDSKPFAVSMWVVIDMPFAPRAVTLAEVPALTISLPLVVAVALATREDISSLAVGDAWLPGSWTIDALGRGRAVLAAPSHERGFSVDLAENGSIVVGEPADVMTESPAIEEAALDAPVVVRIEVGAVSMTAAEWARLRAGDVIETGRRLNEPVVLRVAGREIARGELCDVEGELGVRIVQLTTGDAK